MNDTFSPVCSPENQEMISPELIRSLGMPPAEIYASAENIVKLAKAAGEADGRGFVLLPFCHTVEAKALGADIKPADDTAGPRPGAYALKGPEELSPVEIAKSPEAARLLEACAALASEGRAVVYQLSGPVSILSCMMPLNNFFKILNITSPAYLPQTGQPRLNCQSSSMMMFIFFPLIYCRRSCPY